ncbi:SusC/RagA family TonB-linked outer membrane protein [Olivibacter ginsenosidimutans]|uniref:SusC/RagA family TonB-linked outer membrane protein n=1 Tax=Olivibacter ginsenosidimutans TaxID=1176537 RepID=A0ABP9B6C1_9SPHI
MKILFYGLTVFCVWLAGLTVCNAQYKIWGKVLSRSKKELLSNVTVKISKDGPVTRTNYKGEFNLIAQSDSALLTLSHVGYQTKELSVKLPLTNALVVLLEEGSNRLQEVTISTGYQTLSRERATGAFSHVDEKLFNQQVSTDVLSRLAPIANGLSDDKRTGIGLTVRGLSTIQGIKGPLIVVDNFPYEGDINNINPNDVRDITILKDAAAASIWGAKAGNGVIVITTKKGGFNHLNRVTFNSNFSTAEKSDLFYLKQMKPADYIDYEIGLYGNGYYDAMIGNPNQPALTPVVELLAGGVNPDAAEIGALKNHDVRNDFLSAVYSRPFNQQYALAFDGGSERSSYYLSAGYDHNVDELHAKTQRLNLRYNYSYRILKNLDLSSSLYFTKTQANSGKEGYNSVTSAYGNLYPYARLADTEGQPLSIVKDYRMAYIDTVGQGKLLDWKYYPLDNYKHVRNTESTSDVLLNTGLVYRPTKNITLQVLHQYEQQTVKGTLEQGRDSYYTRDLINLFTQVNTGGEWNYAIPVGGIYDFSDSKLSVNNLRGQLNYQKEWGSNSLYALGGAEIRDARTISTTFRQYGVNEEVLSSALVDYTTYFPTFITGSGRYIPNMDGLGKFTNRFVSLFANAAYTYRGKYTLSGSARRDASNIFGVATNDKWTPLWSAGLSWLLSDENFLKSDRIDFLKLRATYGFSGNVDQSRSALTTISFLSNSIYTGTPYARIERYANPDLKWEKVSTVNVGLDFGLFGSRLNGSVDYYRKKGKDLFGIQMLDYTSGIGSSIVKNVAAMKGSGFDLELNSVNTTDRIRWTSQLNLSYNTDKITENYFPSASARNFVGTSAATNVTGLEGKPVYSVLSYAWAGLNPDTGAPRGYYKGQISEDYTALLGPDVLVDNLVYHGPVLPVYFGSLGNSLTFEGITLTAQLTYKYGYYFRRGSIDYSALAVTGKGHDDYGKRWENAGDERFTDIPSAIYPLNPSRDEFFNGSEATVEKGDHIRLQYINLSYDMSGWLARGDALKTFSFYVNINNVGILWRANKQGIDPDYGTYQIPSPRTYAIGFRGTF